MLAGLVCLMLAIALAYMVYLESGILVLVASTVAAVIIVVIKEIAIECYCQWVAFGKSPIKIFDRFAPKIWNREKEREKINN